MNKRGLGRAAAAVVAGVLATAGLAGPAFAEEEPDPLILAQAFQQKTAAELVGQYADCAGIPGGAVAGTAGWRFDQPVPDVQKSEYMFLFNAGTDEEPEPMVLALIGDKLVRLDFGGDVEEETLKGLVAPKKLTEVDEDPGDEPTELPVPEGVSGGRLDDGDAWLRVPAHWMLYIAALDVAPVKTKLTTFDVAGVCLPTESAPPTAPATTEPAPPAGLPVTGTSTNAWWIAGAGTFAVLVGAGAIVLLRRRRDQVKFVA